MNPPDAVAERRSVPRVFSKQITQIRARDTGVSSVAVTRDVSSQAGYFYTDEAFAEGQQVEIERLDLPSDGVIHESLTKYWGKVVRLDQVEPQHRYGIAVAIYRPAGVPKDDESVPGRRGHSVSLLSKSGLFFKSSDGRVMTVAFMTIALAFIATSLLMRGLRQGQILASREWIQHAERVLAAGHPETAIKDFRAVLSFAPETPGIRLQLAQTLVAAGNFDEAKANYLALRDGDPNSGSLNLALARLDAQSDNPTQAQGYYRAAIAGSWDGDAIASRQRTRLELVRYLLSKKATSDAQLELVLLVQNAPDDLALLMETGSLLMKAGDCEHALLIYNRALTIAPENKSALLGAGEAAYAAGRYVTAQGFFNRLGHSSDLTTEPELTRAQESLNNINDVLGTFPAPGLPAGERADRVLRAWDTATRRLASCANVSLGSILYARTENEMPTVSGELAAVYGTWRNIHSQMKTSRQRWALRNDSALQSQIMSVAFEIERQTAKTCGAPTGADQALLRIAQHPEGVQQ